MKQLKTPAGILKEFFTSSTIWQDICLTMDDWLEVVRDQLENPSGDLDLRTLDRLAGIAEALRRVKGIESYIYMEGESNDGERE